MIRHLQLLDLILPDESMKEKIWNYREEFLFLGEEIPGTGGLFSARTGLL